MTTVTKEKTVAKPKKKTKQDLLDEMMGGKSHLVAEGDYVKKVGSIPSGSLSLDRILGVGGYPRGSIINVFGPESSGKSLLTLMAIADLQKQGGTTVIWDVERSYSKNTDWMRTNGVDTSKIRWLRLGADEGCEVGMQEVEDLVRANVVDLIVVDSVPALVPRKALAKAMTKDDIMAATANCLTRHLRRLIGLLDESETSVIFIDQMRANTQRAGPFAPTKKETTIWALRHFSNIRLDVKRVSKIKRVGDMPYSHRIQIEVKKNKVAKPYLRCELELVYDTGINKVGEVVDILISAGEIKKSNAMYSLGDMKIKGRDMIEAEVKKDYPKYLDLAKKVIVDLKVIGIDADDDEDDTESIGIEGE